MSFFHKSGIVNVKMVITEEKILSNIDKIQKLINPNSKKQIVQLEEDSYFKDLVESVKTYLIEYPKKKNFPSSVYKASYDLVEYATNQFEENTKKIEELIRQREKNIKLASVLRDATTAVKARAKNWKEIVRKIESKYPEDVAEALTIIGKSKDKTSEEYSGAVKLIEAKINNLESNLHIEIDMERIEDRSKALSFIGIEIAEALKYIPAPVEGETENTITTEETEETTNSILATEETEVEEKVAVIETEETQETGVEEVPVADEMDTYIEETRFEAKPSLWQRFKNSKFVRTVRYIMQIRVVLDYPALPEGKGE
jgi:vacuolar-type H+-ATPase subunit I/STV1